MAAYRAERGNWLLERSVAFNHLGSRTMIRSGNRRYSRKPELPNKGMKLSNRKGGGRADRLSSSMSRFAAYARCYAELSA